MARDPQHPAGWYPDPSGAPRRRYWDGGALALVVWSLAAIKARELVDAAEGLSAELC